MGKFKTGVIWRRVGEVIDRIVAALGYGGGYNLGNNRPLLRVLQQANQEIGAVKLSAGGVEGIPPILMPRYVIMSSPGHKQFVLWIQFFRMDG